MCIVQYRYIQMDDEKLIILLRPQYTVVLATVLKSKYIKIIV
jgi:hypothetical protein